MRERVRLYEAGHIRIRVHSAVGRPSIELFVHCCASETDRVQSLLLTVEQLRWMKKILALDLMYIRHI